MEHMPRCFKCSNPEKCHKPQRNGQNNNQLPRKCSGKANPGHQSSRYGHNTGLKQKAAAPASFRFESPFFHTSELDPDQYRCPVYKRVPRSTLLIRCDCKMAICCAFFWHGNSVDITLPINRDSPDGFPPLPTMAAQWVSQHDSGANLIGWDDDLCYPSSVINFCLGSTPVVRRVRYG